ncbi:hypothetical protein CMEL01_12836, partial [Colletotrichum melonis]
CTCLHLTPGTHTAGALAGVSPSCLCSHAPSYSWAGWLLVCCYYGLLLDGWLPPSFEPDLPGQSCLTTSSNQIGLGGVQGTAWGCRSQWPEVGGVSVSCQKFEPLVMEMEEHGQFGGVPERLARRERVCRICCIWSTWRRTKLPWRRRRLHSTHNTVVERTPRHPHHLESFRVSLPISMRIE